MGVEWKREKSELVYRGRRVKLFCDSVKVGGRSVVREVVRLRGAAAALPLLDDGNILLIRQFRYPVSEELLEIPAGVVEEGETPEECIRRELVEETGYAARSMKRILSVYPSPGVVDEVIHIFVATGLYRAEAEEDLDEHISGVVRVDFDEALRMVEHGKIADAKTIIALLFFSVNRRAFK